MREAKLVVAIYRDRIIYSLSLRVKLLFTEISGFRWQQLAVDD
jgi:hypothetical protein